MVLSDRDKDVVCLIHPTRVVFWSSKMYCLSEQTCTSLTHFWGLYQIESAAGNVSPQKFGWQHVLTTNLGFQWMRVPVRPPRIPPNCHVDERWQTQIEFMNLGYLIVRQNNPFCSNVLMIQMFCLQPPKWLILASESWYQHVFWITPKPNTNFPTGGLISSQFQWYPWMSTMS